jgi:hypothetical protein
MRLSVPRRRCCRGAVASGRGGGRSGGGAGPAGGAPPEGDAGGTGARGGCGGGWRGGGSAGCGLTPSIRQSGRSGRASCGAAASRSTTSGSARKCWSCPAKALVPGAARSNQPTPRGRRMGRLGDGVRGTRRRSGAGRSVPARTSAAVTAKRSATRRSQPQSRTASGANPGSTAARAATARQRPSMAAENRAARSGPGCWAADTRRTGSREAGGGQRECGEEGEGGAALCDLPRRLIPSPSDQNPWAQSRIPMDMMRQGWRTRRFQAWQQ